MTALSTIRNAMTVDVEDYFHVSAFEKVIDTANWNSMPRRVGYSTRRILDLFDQHNVKATFFTLGWVAERDPELVKEIASRGHEVASHGYNHGRATEMTREQFRIDVTSSKALLEDLIGQQVLGYRAPSFSINESNTWVFEVLAEAEYAYSSSTYPVKHDLYGVPHWPRFKHQLENGLTEIPLTTLRIGQRNFPISGGGFFRLYPYWLTKWLLSRFIRTESTSGIFYMHPWELDTEQPRVKDISAKSAFRHYLNIHKHEPRLEKMLKDFSWGRMDDVFEIRKSAV
ncbi:MAG: DUF3473 domain-containing protein [Hahellaceae bacterium]|nr:DUF3473 domain-containing protein [Hahellaceae bacterium]